MRFDLLFFFLNCFLVQEFISFLLERLNVMKIEHFSTIKLFNQFLVDSSLLASPVLPQLRVNELEDGILEFF